jgi:hypothetical protein
MLLTPTGTSATFRFFVPVDRAVRFLLFLGGVLAFAARVDGLRRAKTVSRVVRHEGSVWLVEQQRFGGVVVSRVALADVRS